MSLSKLSASTSRATRTGFASVAALAATALVAAGDSVAITAVAGLLVSAIIAVAAWHMTGQYRLIRQRSAPRGREATGLLLYLSPVLLLSVAYPVATSRLTHTMIGGVRLTTVLLASSVTVPWLTQAVCLPMYRAISGHDGPDMTKRICEVWPSTYLRSLPVTAVFAVPVEVATRWPVSTIGAYLLLCVLYIAFAQSLILSIIERRRALWAAGWAAFALTLLIVPKMWFLPPVAGLATQLIPLRYDLRGMGRRVSLERLDVARDLLRGFLMGSVLWADKMFLFIRRGSHFSVTIVFLALLPAILAYNYYFVRLAPRFDRSVVDLRNAMETGDHAELTGHSTTVSDLVADSLGQAGVRGAFLALVVTVVTALVASTSTGFVASVAIASWLFMMTTLFCYKLDYIGRRTQAQIYSLAHLAGCVLLFATLPIGVSLYVGLIVMESAVFALALRSALEHWRAPEYSLFWRHATAW